MSRRSARFALVVLPVALAVAAVVPAARAQEAPTPATPAAAAGFVLGSAGASGQVLNARVYYAGLSIPVPLGQTASTYEGRRARALGAVVSASAVSGLTGTPIEGTSPVVVDSQGEVKELHDSLAAPVVGNVDLVATDDPASSADVHLADVDLPGVLRVEGGRSASSVRIEDGTIRIAEASVTIASLSLAGGLVALEGLRWDASHRSGAAGTEPEATASFTLGALRVGGSPIALPIGTAELAPIVELLNGLLAPVGLSLTLPEVRHLPDGSVDIGALRIALGGSILGREVIGPLLAALRPALLPVLDQLVGAVPELGVVTLLLDLGLGAADGSGGAEVALGGANAVTDDTAFVPPGGGPGTPPTGPTDDGSGGGSGAGPIGATGGPRPTISSPPARPAGPAPTQPPRLEPASSVLGSERCALAASPRRQGGCRLTNDAAALLVAVVAAGALAAYEIAARRRRSAGPTATDVGAS